MKKIILQLLFILLTSLPAYADPLELVMKFTGGFQPVSISDKNLILLRDEAGFLAVQELESDKRIDLPAKLQGGGLVGKINNRGNLLIEKNRRIYFVTKKGRATKITRLSQSNSAGNAILGHNNEILISNEKSRSIDEYNRKAQLINRTSYSDLITVDQDCLGEDPGYIELTYSNLNWRNQVLLNLGGACAEDTAWLLSLRDRQFQSVPVQYHPRSYSPGILTNDAILLLVYHDDSKDYILSKFDLITGDRLRINQTDLKIFYANHSALEFISGYPKLKIDRVWILEEIQAKCFIRNSTGLNPINYYSYSDDSYMSNAVKNEGRGGEDSPQVRILTFNRNGLSIVALKDESLHDDKIYYYIFRATHGLEQLKNEFCPNISVLETNYETSDNGTPEEYCDDRDYYEVNFTVTTPDNLPMHTTGIIYEGTVNGGDITFRSNSDGSATAKFQIRSCTDKCGYSVWMPYNHSKYRSMFVEGNQFCQESVLYY